MMTARLSGEAEAAWTFSDNKVTSDLSADAVVDALWPSMTSALYTAQI